MANNNFKKTIEPALLYGGIAGAAIVLNSIVTYALDASFSVYAQVMAYLLPVIILVITLSLYRKEYLGGFMTYSQSLGMGVMIMAVAALISTVYTFIFMKYIDPNFIQAMMQMQEDKMIAKGLDEATVEKAMEFTAKMRSVGFITIMGFFSAIFMGAVLSAIVSIFLKKENRNPFAAVE